MKLEHSFTVPVGIDEAWRILLDINRVGPCMPGAQIDSVDGDNFTGQVKVKLGPIGLTYKGKASFVEKDEAGHRAVIDARGRDARGNGTAAAKVTATLADEGSNTRVQVDTDLDITGKPAQFGRGVMADVGNKLIGQFADNLSATIEQGSARVGAHAQSEAESAPTGAAQSAEAKPVAAAKAKAAATASAGAAATPNGAARPAASANASVPKPAPPRQAEPINLIESAGPAVAKRLAPVAVALVIILLVIGRKRRK